MRASTFFGLGLALTAALTLLALVAIPFMPDQIPIHWNIRGEIDGYASRWTTLIFSPGLLLFGLGLAAAIPAMSPSGYRVQRFGPTFYAIMFIVQAMFAYIATLLILAGLTPRLDISRWLIAGILIALGLLGNLMGRTRRNFFVGIRTPWTLASDEVWTRTHRFGGRLMFATGVLGGLAIAAGAPPMPVFVTVMAAVLYPIFYSYWIWRQVGN
ncbi:MAG TPA: SdpI family protein [Fimbriimonadaceae bacterium]|nr:SdpI family protein [Fimbriimonadaceae bacterium]